MDITKEKIVQVGRLLKELDIDLWLIFVRETRLQADPAFSLVVGLEATWQSFFAFSRKGDAIALIGDLDQEDYKRSGRFTEVIPYTAGVKEDFLKLIKRLDPKQIAINYSEDDPSSDGLTYGMCRLLCGFLEGTPYAKCLVSGAPVCAKLRGRKTDGEIELLTAAAVEAEKIWHDALKQIKAGMTEKEIAHVIESLMTARGLRPSFETAVNAGDKSAAGHGSPTDARLEAGDLLHVDFGVLYEGYCSDLQRLLYVRRPGETKPPAELRDAFAAVADIITETGKQCRPGARGLEIDAAARQMLKDDGYEEYQHGLGHQLGRSVHDGGALLGPRWERYGATPTIPIEAGNVFTLELEILLAGIGCVGLEEDMVVTADGARFLCPRQLELDLL